MSSDVHVLRAAIIVLAGFLVVVTAALVAAGTECHVRAKIDAASEQELPAACDETRSWRFHEVPKRCLALWQVKP